jgi:acid phosphatase family membrane protein YuiD
MVPLLPGGGVSDLFTNRVFLAGFWAWFTAQTLKVRAAGGGGWTQGLKVWLVVLLLLLEGGV